MNDPELYVSALSSVVEDINSLLKRLSGKFQWKKGEKILDVGSGPGNITIHALLPFIPEDAHVTGFDISEKMIEYANKCNSNDRISYRVQDAQADIPNSADWKPASYDKIFSFYCLHLVPNLDRVARNMFYLMKSGGYLATHFCVTSPYHSVRESLANQPKWKQYLNNDDMSICGMQNVSDPCAYFAGFLKDAGFQDISCKTEKFTYTFPNMDEVLRLCKSVTPFLKKVPETLIDEYLESVRKEMKKVAEVQVADSGKVSITWLNMVTLARKK